MAETAALLADEVLPERPLRQWVLSLPHALRFLLATSPAALTQVLGVVYSAIAGYLLKSAGLTRATGHTGAVTLIQRFGSALNLNIHFHMLFLDELLCHSIAYRIAVGPRAGALPTQDPVSRRHHAHCAGAARSGGKTGSAGAATARALVNGRRQVLSASNDGDTKQR